MTLFQSCPANPLIFAHRGVSAQTPENTQAAFRLAHEQGAAAIELDVQLSRDGVAFVMHDDTLDRTTNGTGLASDYVWQDLAQLDAGSWFAPEFSAQRLPTLSQCLADCARWGMICNIEIKEDPPQREALVQACLAVLADTPLARDRVLISSFDHAALQLVAQAAPDLALGLLYEDLRPDWLGVAQQLSARSIHLGLAHSRGTDIASISQAGFAPFIYTVNQADSVADFWQAGLAGVFSDDPRALKQQLKAEPCDTNRGKPGCHGRTK